MPKESVEVILSTWDYVLRVWAVIGPLLAGAVSAVWSRHNQIQDRDYQNNQHSDKEEKKAEESKVIRAEESSRKKHEELKDACIEFMISSHEYVKKQSEYLTEESPELHDHAREAHDRLISSSQRIILLGNEKLSRDSISFWNTTISVPKNYKTAITKEYLTILNAYKSARTKFNSTAKSQLEEFENKI